MFRSDFKYEKSDFKYEKNDFNNFKIAPTYVQ